MLFRSRKKQIVQIYSKTRAEYQDLGLTKQELSEVEELVAERMLLEEKVQDVSENFLSNRIKSKIAQINEQIKGIVEEGTPLESKDIPLQNEAKSQDIPLQSETESLTDTHPEIQKLEQERSEKVSAASKPNIELSFIPDDHAGLNKETGSVVKVKSGNRMTERPHTLKDSQKAIQREHSLLQKLIDCL